MRVPSIVSLSVALVACGGPKATPVTAHIEAPPDAAVVPVDEPAPARLGFDFERELDPAVWDHTNEDFGLDDQVAHGGARSLRVVATPKGWSVARALLPIERLRGHVLAVRVWMRTAAAVEAYPGCAVHFGEGRQRFVDRSVSGTTEWTAHEFGVLVPPSATAVRCGVVIQGSGEVWIDDLEVELGETLTDAQYEGPVTIAGKVADAAGRPLAGMTVRASNSTDDRPILIGAPAVSGDDGAFQLSLPQGRYELVATDDAITAGVLEDVPVGLTQPRTGLVVTAGGPGHVLSGRVLDPSGAPIAGVPAGAGTVLASGAFPLLMVDTDAGGGYRVALPDGRYVPWARDDARLSPPPTAIDLVADRTVELTLIARAELARPAPDPVVDWIKAKAIPLDTVEAGHGFADLAPLDRIVGKARIVALGEATHGTREFFQMKHRMLEYLVAKRGFTVFLMEANWPESMAVNEYVLHGTGDPRQALAGLYFWVWQTEEVLAMIEWMRAWNADSTHRKKVSFYGIDVQTGTVAVDKLLAYLERVEPALAAQTRTLLAPIAANIGGTAYAALPAADRAALHDGVAALLARFDAQRRPWSKATTPREWLLARQHANLVRQHLRLREPPAGESGYDARDRGMAENAAWVIEEAEPGAKAVLWAHEGHIEELESDGTTATGHHLAARYHQQYVTFGWAFGEGGFQAVVPGQGLAELVAGKAPEGGIDGTFARAGLPLFALDLRTAPPGPVRAWLAAPQQKRSIGALFTTEANMDTTYELSRSFDAMFFIGHTTRARPLP